MWIAIHAVFFCVALAARPRSRRVTDESCTDVANLGFVESPVLADECLALLEKLGREIAEKHKLDLEYRTLNKQCDHLDVVIQQKHFEADTPTEVQAIQEFEEKLRQLEEQEAECERELILAARAWEATEAQYIRKCEGQSKAQNATRNQRSSRRTSLFDAANSGQSQGSVPSLLYKTTEASANELRGAAGKGTDATLAQKRESLGKDLVKVVALSRTSGKLSQGMGRDVELQTLIGKWAPATPVGAQVQEEPFIITMMDLAEAQGAFTTADEELRGRIRAGSQDKDCSNAEAGPRC